MTTCTGPEFAWASATKLNTCPCGRNNRPEHCCQNPDGSWSAKRVPTFKFADTGFDHPRCYLAGSKTCSTKISKEHYISQAILKQIATDGTITLNGNNQGASNFVNKPLPISGLASNILCRTHNSALSVLDDFADRLFEKISSLQDALLDSNRSAPAFCLVDGASLERWMIKVLFGLAATKLLRTNTGNVVEPNELPSTLLDRLIEGIELPMPLRIWAGYAVGQEIEVGKLATTATLFRASDGHVSGIVVRLGLVEIALVIDDKYLLAGPVSKWNRHPGALFNIQNIGHPIGLAITY